jgi:hypothetical protein
MLWPASYVLSGAWPSLSACQAYALAGGCSGSTLTALQADKSAHSTTYGCSAEVPHYVAAVHREVQ